MCERYLTISACKFIKTVSLSESTMSFSVALTTERNQVLSFIVTKFTSGRKVMNLQIFWRATVLALPSIALQNLNSN